MTTEIINLKLEADASGWDKAFRLAEESVGKLGKEVTKGEAAFGKLVKIANDADKAIEKLGSKEGSGGALDGLIKKFFTMELATKAAGKAFQIAGDYLKGAFERAKIDPALAGINQLRIATESWTTELESSLDRILNKAAKSVIALSRAMSINAIEMGLAERARRAGTTVDQERMKAVNEAFISGEAMGHYGGTLEDTVAREAAMSALWGGATMGKDVEGWGAMGPKPGRGRGFGAGLRGGFNFLGGVGARAASGIGYGVSHIGTGYHDADRLMTYDMAGAAMGFMTGPGASRMGDELFGGAGGFGGLLGEGRGDFDDFAQGLAEKRILLEGIVGSLTSVGDSITSTIAASIAAGEAGVRATLRQGAAHLKVRAITEGVEALASFWNPPAAAAHAAAAAAALAGMAALGVMGGGIGGGGGGGGGYATPAGGGYVRGPGGGQGGGHTTIVQFGEGFALATKGEIIDAIGEAQRAGERSGRMGVRGTVGAVSYRG